MTIRNTTTRITISVIIALAITGAALFLGSRVSVKAQDETPEPETSDTGIQPPSDGQPDECAVCHQEAYEAWQGSTHAGAYTDPKFIEARMRAGNPTYCFSCHTTGYDPTSGKSETEAVACRACHTAKSDDAPGPHMTVDKSSQMCGECHTGTHSPNYDEWLVSKHATVNVGCVDCHSTHDGHLRMEDTAELCTSCHKSAAADSVHGADGMTCTDCHMASGDEVVDSLSGQRNGAGHTFSIPANVCAKCHGMTHTLKQQDRDLKPAPSAEEVAAQMTALEEKADNNLNVGLTGGGIAGLVFGGVASVVLLRRVRK
jgi:predicted CXXCH cytochrome family protein